jgi:hypothetical protein
LLTPLEAEEANDANASMMVRIRKGSAFMKLSLNRAAIKVSYPRNVSAAIDFPAHRVDAITGGTDGFISFTHSCIGFRGALLYPAFLPLWVRVKLSVLLDWERGGNTLDAMRFDLDPSPGRSDVAVLRLAPHT